MDRPIGTRARLWSIADRLRLPTIAGHLRRPPGWTILWAHGISSDSAAPLEHYPRDVAVSVFRAQMEYLLSQGYRFVTMSEGIERLTEGEPLDRCATVTFDDGFRSVVERAYPVMVELGVKGCLYVVADYIGTSRLLWTDMVDLLCTQPGRPRELEFRFGEARRVFPLHDLREGLDSAQLIKRALRSVPEHLRQEYFIQIEQAFAEVGTTPDDYLFASWEQLQRVDPGLLEIGNHTRSHPNLANVTDRTGLRCEIAGARAVIETRLARPVVHFCYPAGSYDSRVLEEVAQSGHVSAVTIEYGTNICGQPSYELKRFGLPATLAHFKARMSGLEGAVLSVRRAVGMA